MIRAVQAQYEAQLASLTFLASLFTLFPHEIWVLAALSNLRPQSTLGMVVPTSLK